MTGQRAPRRVLMTADTVGGVWTYAMELAAALAARSVAVDLATMGRPLSLAQRIEADDVPNLRIHESDFKLEWMDDPWEDVDRAGQWLLGLERSLAPDVVHLNGYAHAALDWAAPVLVVAHSCVCSWWRAVRGGSPPASWDEYRRRVRAGLEAADMVIAPSVAMLRALESSYSIFGPPGRARVAPNGRSARHFAPAAKREYVFAAGRVWDEAKNIAALDRIAESIPWPILVAGDGQGPGSGRSGFSKVEGLGLLGRDELASWLAHASIYALPARYEPFGLSVLEAGLSACALVLGDIPSLRENWDRAAVFVPPDDHDALREAVNGLILDPALRGRLGDAARGRALSFGPDRTAALYLDAYSRVMPERPAGPGEPTPRRLPCAS